jgi:hypothetical protein
MKPSITHHLSDLVRPSATAEPVRLDVWIRAQGEAWLDPARVIQIPAHLRAQVGCAYVLRLNEATANPPTFLPIAAPLAARLRRLLAPITPEERAGDGCGRVYIPLVALMSDAQAATLDARHIRRKADALARAVEIGGHIALERDGTWAVIPPALEAVS